MTLREITEGVFIVAGCACLLIVTAKDMDEPKVIVKRVEVCSPRSVDAYSPAELIEMGKTRKRMAAIGGRVK